MTIPRPQFTLRALLGQMTLVAVALALLAGTIASSGIEQFCLYELTAASFGAMVGLMIACRIGKPFLCAAAFAGFAMPLALIALPAILSVAEIVARITR